MSYRSLVLCIVLGNLVAGLLFGTLAQAGQIWDSELKRYLTPQEMAQEDVLLTPEDAAKLTLPDSERIRQDVLSLGPEQKTLVQNRIGWNFPESSFDVFIGETQDKIDGYALIQNTIGKHKHMTYMVGVNQQGEVTNVELLVYRESRGSEVGRKRFNYQYQGKDLSDPIRINRDVINISGATMSVRSMSAGIKRVLVLVDEFYLKPLGLEDKAIHTKGADKGFWTSLFGEK